MTNKEYIERLQMVIRQLHGADSKHVESVPVLETFKGKTVWEGIVEVFTLSGHAKANRCYAWSDQGGAKEKFTAVLDLPPAITPKAAVQVAAAAEIRKARR